MPDSVATVDDPRWGQKGRDRKAEAILATMERHCRRDLKQGLWLDIGCGSGGIAATLAAHVKSVVGIDPESWKRWQAFREQQPNLEFHAGSYRDLVGLLGAESVDAVICNQVYEHVDDPVDLLRAIHQVMKPGGACYFAGPNLIWPIEPHVFWPFVHWLPRRFSVWLMTVCRARYANCLDAWSWPYWKLVRAFQDTGFDFKAAIGERIHVEAENGDSRLFRAISLVPPRVLSAAIPMAPSFIFVLTKAAPNS